MANNKPYVYRYTTYPFDEDLGLKLQLIVSCFLLPQTLDRSGSLMGFNLLNVLLETYDANVLDFHLFQITKVRKFPTKSIFQHSLVYTAYSDLSTYLILRELPYYARPGYVAPL